MFYMNRKCLRLITCVVLIWGVCMVANAQSGPNSTYSHFSDLSDFSKVQIRLTYISDLQDEETSPIIFTTTGQSPGAAIFVAFEQSAQLYPAPEVGIESTAISVAQMQQLIANTGTIDAVNTDSVATIPWVSIAMSDDSGDQPLVAEAILHQADSATLLQQIGNAVADNGEAFALVSELACSTGGLVPERPVDVSADVTVARTGVRLDRASNSFVSLATLKNTTANSIAGPMSLAFNFSEGGVSLKNSLGVTCGTSPVGLAYVNVPLNNNELLPGESVEVSLSFASPDRAAVTATTKVLSGPGAR